MAAVGLHHRGARAFWRPAVRNAILLLIMAGLLPPGARAEWSEAFHPPGWFDGNINAEAVYQGDLVVAGSFRYAGGLAVNGIARWDGSRWRSFGEGFDGTIKALLVVGDTLVAAGDFHHFGSTEAHSVARWDGTAWSAMGSGIRGRVNCLTGGPGRIVAGGYFREAGGLPARNSAIWSGTEWSPIVVGGDPDPREFEVTCLAAVGDTIVAAWLFACQGQTPDPDGVPCGIQVWTVAGDGTRWDYHLDPWDYTPESVHLVDGKLYSIGRYTVFTPPWDYRFGYGVFRWTGRTWVQMGQDFDEHNWTSALALHQGRVTLALSYGIFQWDGTAWQRLLSYHDGAVSSLVEYGGQLVIGGSFFWDDPTRRCLAGWDGSTWHSFGDQSGEGVNGIVRGMALTSGGLFVTGSIDHAGRAPAGRWAGWKDGRWTIPPAAVAGEAHPLVSYHDSLYAAGAVAAGCIPYCSGLARWDGGAWKEVAGISGQISSLVEHQGSLIAGGSLVTPQGPVLHAAAFDGGSWAPLDDGLRRSAVALLSYRGGLYTGWGAENQRPPTGVARWDGSIWSPLGDTLAWEPLALAGYANGIVAGGITWHYGDDRDYSTYSLNRWDGTSWQPMADQPNAPVTSFAVYHGDLIASGVFSKIGETTAPGLARWDGTSWSAFGGGLDRAAYTLLVQGDSLWVGGALRHAGGIPSSGVALWVEPRPWIRQLQAAWSDDTATVSWVLPSDPAVRGAVVRSSVGGFPVDPKDGDPLPGGSGGGVFPGSPGMSMEVRQPVPPDGKVRYYTAFAYTDPASYSRPAHASVMPADLIAPVVTMDVSRDPDTSRVMSVRLGVSEPLDSAGIALWAGGRPVALTATDPRGTTWGGVLDLAQLPGATVLSATATDAAGNQGVAGAEFSTNRIRATDGSIVESADGRLHLRLFPSSVPEDRIVTIIRTDTTTTPWPAYLVQPSDSLAVPGMVTFEYGDALTPGDDPLRLQLLEDDRPLASYVDGALRTVAATIDHLGRFSLRLNPAAASLRVDPAYLRLDGPEPNPFRDATRIRLEIRAEQHVSALIYGVDGRLTRHLLDATLPPGETRVRWDGTTDQGTRAASGLYLCRISGERSHGLVRVVRIR